MIEVIWINNYDPENDLGQLNMNLPPFWRLNILRRLIDRDIVSENEAKKIFEGIKSEIVSKEEGDK